MTIYSKIQQFKHQGSFEGWIKRITVNTVLQKYRKEETLRLVTDNIEDEMPEDSGYLNLDLATLLSYVQELPNKYRLTFNLYVLDGYSHKEISEMLGTSLGTYKSNLDRARMILKEKIEANKAGIIMEG
ncbi:MAG: RNA polymerase sigma factor [Arenibacter algicola]|nr:RNA polymerase sigma factor [Arenibacter algicola]